MGNGNDDEPDAPGYCSYLDGELEAGTYYVRVGELGNNSAMAYFLEAAIVE